MDKQRILIATDYGLFTRQEPRHWQSFMDYCQQLRETQRFQLEWVLGQRAEGILRHWQGLTDETTHFSLRGEEALAQAAEALIETQDWDCLIDLHAPLPLSLWQQVYHKVEELRQGAQKFELFGFASGRGPTLVGPGAKQKLRVKIRQGEAIKSQDFDWRLATTMAEISLPNDL